MSMRGTESQCVASQDTQLGAKTTPDCSKLQYLVPG